MTITLHGTTYRAVLNGQGQITVIQHDHGQIWRKAPPGYAQRIVLGFYTPILTTTEGESHVHIT